MKPRKQRLHSAELRRLDNIAAALDRIATAIERHPTTEIDRIDVGQGVGVQDGGTTEVNINSVNKIEGDKNVVATRSPAAGAEIDSSQIKIDSEGDNVKTSGSDAVGKVVGDVGYYTNHAERGIAAKSIDTADQRTEIKGVSKAFNTNSNDVVKDLTTALLTKHKKDE